MTHIVLTTINYPDLLRAYYSNLQKFGHLSSTVVWVVGDIRTPPEVGTMCAELSRRGLRTIFLDCDWQTTWATRHPCLAQRFPWNNETRRNIGYLQALQSGCERIISIDDDNWPTDDDFVEFHNRTGSTTTDSLLYEPSGFHNICDYLSLDSPRVIYPRGFPFNLRGSRNEPILKKQEGSFIIGATAGLWLNEPDIDATTWLNGRVLGLNYTGPDSFVLDQDTWTPINTQNTTSLANSLLPTYVFPWAGRSQVAQSSVTEIYGAGISCRRYYVARSIVFQ
jgi:hypothetical protein